MLIRTGAGHSARLSIPRDTVVEIPGHGMQKINAAHAFGGPALSVAVIKRWLNIPINHVVEVNFENFPQLIDSMGGVTYTGPVRHLAPGRRLQPGRVHAAPERGHPPHRRQAGARAGPHQGEPVPAERKRPQPRGTPAGAVQRDEEPAALTVELRAPALDLVEHAAGDHLRHERGGTARPVRRARRSAAPRPREVLKPTGQVTLPGGSEGLTISQAAKEADVARFMSG